MSEELKECPFCGKGNVVVREVIDGYLAETEAIGDSVRNSSSFADKA